MNIPEHFPLIKQNNLIKNAVFTDKDGNASKEFWNTNSHFDPVRIPGGRHQLSLGRQEYIRQKLTISESARFKVHYAFLAAATHPSHETYIRVKVANALADEEIDIVVNNKILYPRQHIGSRVFSPSGGELELSIANQVLNPERLITLTEIALWIEPV